MASVYEAATHAASTTLSVVSTTAQAVDQTVRLLATGIDMLDLKARVMSRGVSVNAALEAQRQDNELLLTAVADHVEALKALHKRLHPTTEFDQASVVAATLAQFKAAMPTKS